MSRNGLPPNLGKRALGPRIGALVAGVLLVPSLAASPAEAGLLDSVTDTVTDTTTGVTEPITDSLGDLAGSLGPAGWLFDESQAPMDHVRSVIGADAMWARGYTGRGVGVAVVDTGVVPITGLESGNVVNGPDLSFESQIPDARYYDSFGHGTHMTGIIAGKDPYTLLDVDRFQGVAPDAKVTSLKVGSYDGAVDVSQVVAAIDWVVAHRNDDPRNPIRVLNLSYGTEGVQDYRVDPLTHAVENAWRAGIVVVVSAGNDGDSGKLNNPAHDPHIIAVGAADTKGTVTTVDDTVPEFSSRGDASRRVDLVAPGRSIVSLRDPGSFIDTLYPGARVGDRFFKGSGSSQAAAVVSGAVALLLEQRPALTPNQVKSLLVATAAPMPLADAAGRGAGEIDLAAARVSATPRVADQPWPESTGTGSLEQARGGTYVFDGESELTGERDIFGPWKAERWARASSAGKSWDGGRWNGRDWTAGCWCGSSWTRATWGAVTWPGTTWSGRRWAGDDWSGRRWAGRRWAGEDWAGEGWSGRRWAGRRWAGRRWAGSDWN